MHWVNTWVVFGVIAGCSTHHESTPEPNPVTAATARLAPAPSDATCGADEEFAHAQQQRDLADAYTSAAEECRDAIDVCEDKGEECDDCIENWWDCFCWDECADAADACDDALDICRRAYIEWIRALGTAG